MAPFTAGNFTDTPNSNDEVITIYEIMESEPGKGFAVPSYQFEWPVITDPMGVTRNYIAYPGTCVPVAVGTQAGVWNDFWVDINNVKSRGVAQVHEPVYEVLINLFDIRAADPGCAGAAAGARRA